MSNGTGGTPPFVGSPTESSKNFLQFLQTLGALSGARGGQQPPQGGGGLQQPAQIGQSLPSLPPVPGAPMPNPPMTQTGGGYQGPPGPRPIQPQYQFSNPQERTAYNVSTAIQTFGNLAQGIHQRRFQKEAAAAEQTWATYLALTKELDTAKQTNDPQQMQSAQQRIQAFTEDKQVQKVLQTISDPKKALSATSVGVQRAMQMSQAQAMQQATLEAERAKAAAEYQRGQQEKAHAELYTKQAEQEGQVTPKVRAELGQKEAAQTAATMRVSLQVKGMNDRAVTMAEAMKASAQIRADAIKGAFKDRKDDKVLGSLSKEYTGILNQIKELDTQNKDLQKTLSDHPIMDVSWWRSKEFQEKHDQIAKNAALQDALRQQLTVLDQKVQVMQKVGVLPDMDFSGGQQGMGTPESPMIVQPEDLNP